GTRAKDIAAVATSVARAHETGRGLPHSKAWPKFCTHIDSPSVLECGSPLPLFGRGPEKITRRADGDAWRTWLSCVSFGHHLKLEQCSAAALKPGPPLSKACADALSGRALLCLQL